MRNSFPCVQLKRYASHEFFLTLLLTSSFKQFPCMYSISRFVMSFNKKNHGFRRHLFYVILVFHITRVYASPFFLPLLLNISTSLSRDLNIFKMRTNQTTLSLRFFAFFCKSVRFKQIIVFVLVETLCIFGHAIFIAKYSNVSFCGLLFFHQVLDS